jgi:two-component system, chemotaxis family, chemotaxis protein CheY
MQLPFSAVKEQSQQTPTVLVADDDAAIRRMITTALCREHYAVLEAANGREALEIMRRKEPSVVVLDLMMPEVSGWEVLDERAGDPSLQSIPVIVLSANREPELAMAMNGTAAFMQKPFELTALKEMIRTLAVSR